MTKKVYRTAQGKTVDLGALILQNETVRAVGNMKVNARGDVIDGNNRQISSRNQQVQKQYSRQTTNVSDEAVVASRHRARAQADAVAEPPVAEPEIPGDFLDAAEPVSQEPPAVTTLPEGGLASAIARARQIKQEPLKTPRQQAQQTPGVKKI